MLWFASASMSFCLYACLSASLPPVLAAEVAFPPEGCENHPEVTSFLQRALQVRQEPSSAIAQPILVKELSSAADANNTNIVFIRIAKTASTTCDGITRRIGLKHNLNGVFVKRQWPAKAEPGVWADHGALDRLGYGPNPANEPVTANKDLLPSWQAMETLTLPTFMWTVIRDPTSRALSQYYWVKSRGNQPWFSNQMFYLKIYGGNNQFKYIRKSPQDTVDDVLSMYGMIAITERMPESMVVLAAILKIPLSDVLYVEASKQNSEHIPFDEEPQDVQEYMNGTFRQKNDLDIQLLQRANALLSARIKDMHLESAVEKFNTFLANAQETCKVEGSDRAPIETLTKCIIADEACNYECLAQFDEIGRKTCEWCSV